MTTAQGICGSAIRKFSAVIPGPQIDPATFNRGISVLIDHICAVLAKLTETEKFIS